LRSVHKLSETREASVIFVKLIFKHVKVRTVIPPSRESPSSTLCHAMLNQTTKTEIYNAIPPKPTNPDKFKVVNGNRHNPSTTPPPTSISRSNNPTTSKIHPSVHKHSNPSVQLRFAQDVRSRECRVFNASGLMIFWRSAFVMDVCERSMDWRGGKEPVLVHGNFKGVYDTACN
jgi:hypothetical protein